MYKEAAVIYVITFALFIHASLLACTKSTCMFEAPESWLANPIVKNFVHLINEQNLISLSNLHLIGHICLVADTLLMSLIIIRFVFNVITNALKLWLIITVVCCISYALLLGDKSGQYQAVLNKYFEYFQPKLTQLWVEIVSKFEL